MLEVKTKTTGFGSPAESYVDRRLDLNDLINTDPYTTFFFEFSGEDNWGVKTGDILVVDRSVDPNPGDLIVNKSGDKLQISKYTNNQEIWGTIIWTLSQLKK